MKKLFTLIIGLFLTVSAFGQTTATSGTCGYSLQWSYDTSTKVLTITGTGAMQNFAYQSIVPWSNHRNNITSVSLPNGITHIGNYAFSGCSGLTSVTIPNSVTSIGNYAFTSCFGLTEIIISNSVTSIGDYAFNFCSALTSLTIGNSVRTIGQGAFRYCFGLTSVTIPNSVTTIAVYAFSNCTGLTSISIPNSVTTIGGAAFEYCTSLTSLPIIPNSVTTIGQFTFQGCTGLTSITIPNWITSIGNDAFSGCNSLTSVTIPNSVTSIGGNAFFGCIGLTSVINEHPTPQVINASVFNASYTHLTPHIAPNLIYTNATLYVPATSLALYQAAEGWREFRNIVAIPTSSINDFLADKLTIVGYYSILGHKLPTEPQSGVYIILYDDGSTEKRMK